MLGINLEQFTRILNDQTIAEDAQIVSENGALVSGGEAHKITDAGGAKPGEVRGHLYRAVADAFGGGDDGVLQAIRTKLGIVGDDAQGYTAGLTTSLSKRDIREVVNLTNAVTGKGLVGVSALPDFAAVQAPPPLGDDDLRAIAGLAFGNGAFEGKSGGAGYMALVDGKPVKFLTRSGERSDFKSGKVPLFESDKAVLDKATKELGDRLRESAKGLAPARRARVLSLLVKEQVSDGKTTFGFFSRETVAAVLSVFAEEAKEKGAGFDWNDVKPVRSEGAMTLEEQILKHDASHIAHWGEFDGLLIGEGGRVNDAGLVAERLKAYIGSTCGAEALAKHGAELDAVAGRITKALTTPFPGNRDPNEWENIQAVRDAVKEFDDAFEGLYAVFDQCRDELDDAVQGGFDRKVAAFKQRQVRFECEMLEDSEVRYLKSRARGIYAHYGDNAEVVDKLRDAKYVSQAGTTAPMGLESCPDMTDADLEHAEEEVWTGNEFCSVSANSADATTIILGKHPGAGVSTQILANGHDLGQDIGSCGYSREGLMLSQTSPETLAYLLKEGKVEKYISDTDNDHLPCVRYRYVRDAPEPLSTSQGYIINSRMKSGEMKLLFTSMPVFWMAEARHAVPGDADWLCRNLVRMGKITSAEVPAAHVKAQRFIKEFIRLWDVNAAKFSGKIDSRDAMTALLFGDLDGICDVLCEEEAVTKEATRLLQGLLSETRGKARGADTLVGKASRNYEKAIRLSFRAWIIEARKKGTEYFVGGGLCDGSTDERDSFVAKVFAEEFVAYGGKMKYVYAQLGDRDGEVQEWNRFKDEFRAAAEAKGVGDVDFHKITPRYG